MCNEHEMCNAVVSMQHPRTGSKVTYVDSVCFKCRETGKSIRHYENHLALASKAAVYIRRNNRLSDHLRVLDAIVDAKKKVAFNVECTKEKCIECPYRPICLIIERYQSTVEEKCIACPELSFGKCGHETCIRDNKALSPCPFCGGIPVVVPEHHLMNFARVCCTNCNAGTSFGAGHAEREEAIKEAIRRWNKRKEVQ